jgi:predicted class III extradiol MEMO1 family dioxygenase
MRTRIGRFSYTFYDASRGAIHESIQWLDHEGMRIIESQNASAFYDYRKKYKNTICGRHPIAILLEVRRECVCVCACVRVHVCACVRTN